jgi:mono/diheme cytochrome c family protein
MPSITRWLGVPAALALAMALGTWSRPAAAQQASADGSTSQFVGSDLFRNYCVACHGKEGRGDGALGDLMKKRPPDLTMFSRNNGGVFPSELVRKIIDGRQPVTGHGGKDMPVWGDAFQGASGGSGEAAVQARIEALVRHVESLQVKATN